MSTSDAIMIEKLQAKDVTPEMLEGAAALFSSSYGVWGPLAAEKMSQRVKMSVARLREQCLAPDTRSVFVRALSNGELAGYVFATRWDYQGRQVCWVTQLCVSPAFRGQKLATKLLLELRTGENDRGFGILSSHPHAILAALRAFGRGVEEVDLGMARVHAQGIIDASPVEYVRGAKLTGTLFGIGSGMESGTCCADTSFWVDHTEPLTALQQVKGRGVQWPFGELPEGCEYIVLVKGAEVDGTGQRVRRQENSSDF
ncbi:hypothetical protein SLS60_005352 [Paraconiothyrium brasiliense]|uniref:N-acetyltransferase domain-containing protein n=1 Tax=Paraconiothyrium brasiliense TaxID=300254 RepID=A0ABR3RIN5_9PLEO